MHVHLDVFINCVKTIEIILAIMLKLNTLWQNYTHDIEHTSVLNRNEIKTFHYLS